MGQILIRNLDDAVIAQLNERARLRGTSMEAEARHILENASQPTPDERLALSRALRAGQGTARPLTLEEIREGLE